MPPQNHPHLRQDAIICPPIRLFVQALTYAGAIDFSITTVEQLCPDPKPLADGLRAELDRLVALAHWTGKVPGSEAWNRLRYHRHAGQWLAGDGESQMVRAGAALAGGRRVTLLDGTAGDGPGSATGTVDLDPAGLAPR